MDSGKKLTFKIAKAPVPENDDEVLLRVSAEGDVAAAKATFTVVTSADVTRVRFTNKDAGNTITASRNGSSSVTVNVSDGEEPGTLVWTITINHMTGIKVTYDCQAFVSGKYTAAKEVTVDMTAAA